MGVPTMYSYLLQHWEDKMDPQQQQAAKAAAAGLRLTVSGSAACPVVLLERWRALTGQTLLERYGMTETGMILSNPYQVGKWRLGKEHLRSVCLHTFRAAPCVMCMYLDTHIASMHMLLACCSNMLRAA
jgi:acyl-CoA synthetase (AMP-forming)/AMP-acid ligase II